MTTADLPGLVLFTPLVALEFWYFGQPRLKRPKWVNIATVISLLVLVGFAVFRVHTDWGVVKF